VGAATKSKEPARREGLWVNPFGIHGTGPALPFANGLWEFRSNSRKTGGASHKASEYVAAALRGLGATGRDPHSL
jgi:hypothetical protein